MLRAERARGSGICLSSCPARRPSINFGKSHVHKPAMPAALELRPLCPSVAIGSATEGSKQYTHGCAMLQCNSFTQLSSRQNVGSKLL